MSSSNEEKVFKCTNCGEEFSMPEIIERGIHQHCDRCGKRIKVISHPEQKKDRPTVETTKGAIIS
jgi:DNA-directed RNA polymerase subunit RPC12/RpoP